jgi:hypothetical protein
MVAALILAVGLLACLAVVFNFMDGGGQSTEDILREMDAWRDEHEEAWRQEYAGYVLAQVTSDALANMSKGRDKLLAAHAAEEAAREKASVAARKATAAREREKEETYGPAIKDVTSALVGMGWPASESKPLAQGAVKALGPDASLEDLTIYALSHTP